MPTHKDLERHYRDRIDEAATDDEEIRLREEWTDRASRLTLSKIFKRKAHELIRPGGGE